MKHEIKPVATFGDLVLVAGYGNHLFAVEAYYYEYYYEPDAELTEVVYDLTCVYGDSGYIIGDQSDVTLACRSEKADEFLQAYKPAPTVDDTPTGLRGIYFAIGNGGEVNMAKQTIVAKIRIPSKQEQVDALLDQMSDFTSLKMTLGDENGDYQRKIDAIKAQIKEVSEGRR